MASHDDRLYAEEAEAHRVRDAIVVEQGYRADTLLFEVRAHVLVE